MKNTLFSCLLLLLNAPLFAQVLYFPPLVGDEWETTSPEELGWCTDSIASLYGFLEEEGTKAFLVLKDGKIVLEEYFGTFTQDSLWYWASAGKSLTAFLVGLAQEDGYLSIEDPSYQYLGEGWTSCNPEDEQQITIWNQLTMTTGFDDGVDDPDCYDPECLQCLAAPGTRWAYHNAPYTSLGGVLENATGSTINDYFNTKIRNKTGMAGFYFSLGYNRVFFSTPRQMARFGLIVLNNGYWDQTPVLADTVYIRQMITPSQNINKSYGYLWWLNGQESFMLPQSQFVVPWSLAPNAPADMVSALGKNGQILNVVPSQNLIVIRMGNASDNFLVGTLLNDLIWERLNHVICTTTATQAVPQRIKRLSISPNPAQHSLSLKMPKDEVFFSLKITDTKGRVVQKYTGRDTQEQLDISHLENGVYVIRAISMEGKVYVGKFVKA